jgi:hypothetical protein
LADIRFKNRESFLFKVCKITFRSEFSIGIPWENGMALGQDSRFNLSLPATFYGDQEGVGTVTNLSRAGCQMNSGTQMHPGNELTLHLYIHEGDRPIVVDRTAVRWVNGNEVGLSFVSFQNAEQARLDKFLDAQSGREATT